MKITLPGPFTMTQQAQTTTTPTKGALAMAYADGVNEEIRDLVDAGVDVSRSTSPICKRGPRGAGVRGPAIDRALEG